MSSRRLLWPALAGASAVALGAFGAHALRSRVGPDDLAIWQTAVQYHLLHAVVLLALVLFGAVSERPVTRPLALFGAGIAIFSGTLYLLVLLDWRWMGALTPIGGLLLIAGWLSLVPLARRTD